MSGDERPFPRVCSPRDVKRWRFFCMALAPTAPRSLAPVDGSTRRSFARIPAVQPVPNLIQIQCDSFRWFLNEGLKELFAELSPISDFTGRNMELELAV